MLFSGSHVYLLQLFREVAVKPTSHARDFRDPLNPESTVQMFDVQIRRGRGVSAGILFRGRRFFDYSAAVAAAVYS